MSSEESPQFSSSNIIVPEDVSEIPKHLPDAFSVVGVDQHISRDPIEGEQVLESSDIDSSVTKDEFIASEKINFNERAVTHISEDTASENEETLEIKDAGTFVLNDVCAASEHYRETDCMKKDEKRVFEESEDEKVSSEIPDAYNNASNIEPTPQLNLKLTEFKNEHVDQNTEKIKSKCTSSKTSIEMNTSDDPHNETLPPQSKLSAHTGAIPKQKKNNAPVSVPYTNLYQKLITKFKRFLLTKSSNPCSSELLKIFQSNHNSEILLGNNVFRDIMERWTDFRNWSFELDFILSQAKSLIDPISLKNKDSKEVKKEPLSNQRCPHEPSQIYHPSLPISNSPTISTLSKSTDKKNQRKTEQALYEKSTILDDESKFQQLPRKRIHINILSKDFVTNHSDYVKEISDTGETSSAEQSLPASSARDRTSSIAQSLSASPCRIFCKTTTHPIKNCRNFITFKSKNNVWLTAIQPCVTCDYNTTKSLNSNELKKELFSMLENMHISEIPYATDDISVSRFPTIRNKDQTCTADKFAEIHTGALKFEETDNQKEFSGEILNKQPTEEQHQKQKPQNSKTKGNELSIISALLKQLENKSPTENKY